MTVKDPLTNWTTLNIMLHTLSEDRLRELLTYEVNNKKRKEFVIRLHRRQCTLRASRERAALLKKIATKNKTARRKKFEHRIENVKRPKVI